MQNNVVIKARYTSFVINLHGSCQSMRASHRKIDPAAAVMLAYVRDDIFPKSKLN
jgi:hypothetical protein